MLHRLWLYPITTTTPLKPTSIAGGNSNNFIQGNNINGGNTGIHVYGYAGGGASLAITKLDGTAKGGVVIGISDQFKNPVKYIGVGEGIEDLQVFNKFEFVDSFFK
jgi:hypothetical protein